MFEAGKYCRRSPKINARTKFEIGPAIATHAGPHFWSFKLYGLNGTGFAYANRMPVGIIRSGKMTEQKKSICARGFSVSRPAYRAVASPSRSATQPWEYSCRMAEAIITMRKKSMKETGIHGNWVIWQLGN